MLPSLWLALVTAGALAQGLPEAPGVPDAPPASVPASSTSGATPAVDQRLALLAPATVQLVDGLLAQWYLPQARQFADSAVRLQRHSQAWCDRPALSRLPAAAPADLIALRRAWIDSMQAWTRLSAVSTGPLLTRRSESRIDFPALRLPALERAIAQPQTPAAEGKPPRWDLDRVGAQARGLAALEHLLWRQPARPGGAACAYLVALAADVRREADGLAADFAAEAAAPRDAAQAAEWFNTWANQWLGGVSRLRWREIEMPLKSWGMAQAPRAASGQTAAAWATRWAALRQLTVGGPGASAGWLPLAGYLRQRGLSAEAEALLRETAQLDQALAGVGPSTPAERLLAAGARLDTLAHVLDRQVADRLALQIEFSSDDGD